MVTVASDGYVVKNEKQMMMHIDGVDLACVVDLAFVVDLVFVVDLAYVVASGNLVDVDSILH